MKGGDAGFWITCDVCGKRGYWKRADAKRARQHTPGDRFHIYECVSGLLHIGHTAAGMPRTVARQRMVNRSREVAA